MILLTPVYILKLKGSGDEDFARHTKSGSAVKLFNQGIIIPSYACTLQEIPKPISEVYALKLLKRLAPAIDFIHDNGWLHCQSMHQRFTFRNELSTFWSVKMLPMQITHVFLTISVCLSQFWIS